MSSSNDSISKSYYSKNHHYHRHDRYYKDYSKSKSRNGSKYYNKYNRSRSREREDSKYRRSNREFKEKKSHSRKPPISQPSEKSKNNIIINKSNNISQEKKTDEEIALERMKRKAKAQLLIMLDNEEKIQTEVKNLNKDDNPAENLETSEKVNNNLSNNINSNINNSAEIGADPLDLYMEEFNKKNQIVKQVTTLENDFENKNSITLEEIVEYKEDPDENIKQEENEIIEKEEEDYHDEFINAINNALDEDNDKNKDKIESNKNKNSESMILYDEDHYEYKNNISSINNEIDNIWKSMKNNIDKEKDLKIVDHSKMNYDYFTKNIYIESPEISALTPEQVIQIRKNNGSILVKGKDIPKPIQDFYQCGLNSKIISVLENKEIKKPFPIQMQAIPTIMSGRDCLGISETGSGKTLAYVLPLLRHVQSRLANMKLLSDNYFKTKDERGPIALILVPTRELAVQICQEIKNFTKLLNMEITCLFGGSNLGNQISELKKGVDIAVATPARLIELLCLSNGRIINLFRTTFVVLDEADRMFDLGFEPQISKIIRNVRPQRQIVMFSATFPRQIQNMAKKILKKPVEIVVGSKGQGAKNIEQHVEIIKKEKSFLRLLELLEKYIEICTIIFVDEQNEAIELWKQLFKKGFSVCLLYGTMDQEDRIDNLETFKKGEKNILITTSICARGLDVPRCGLVINFRCPNHMEDYIHRIGRTARAFNKGIAYTFIDPDEEDLYADDIIKVLEISEQDVPDELKELARNYRQKLLKGEANKFKISGYLGRGYKFNKLEKEKKKLEYKLLGQGQDINNNNDNDDINNNINKELKLLKEEENEEKNKSKESQALIIHKKSLIEQHKERIKLMRRDPKAKQMALDIGMKAAKAAFIAGKKEEEIIKIVQDAITKGLANYKPNVSLKEGTQNAYKIIEQWENEENIKKHVFSVEFEINEYPIIIRNKLTKKEFLKQLSDNEDVDITLRGTFCEPGKNLLPGHKALQLLIKGKTQFDVNRAYINIKRYFDEAALNYFTHYDADYIGKISKFHS